MLAASSIDDGRSVQHGEPWSLISDNHAAPLAHPPSSIMLRSVYNAPAQGIPQGVTRMEVAHLFLPVFAIIVTGWLAEWSGYISRSLADGLVHFAYNVAIP